MKESKHVDWINVILAIWVLGSIFGIFVTEGVVIALMAWGLGALLSWPLSLGLVSALSAAMSLPLAYAFSWAGVGFWLVAVIAIAVVASMRRLAICMWHRACDAETPVALPPGVDG